MKGVLITFEGIDGSGKSTQASLLAGSLRAGDRTILFLREPGGSLVGERIRSVLLDPALTRMVPLAELFLYLAARAQVVGELIVPALERGETVILDRFSDSSVAYQGCARGLGYDLVKEQNDAATGGIVPDITFLLDCDPAAALSRLDTAPDRLESEGLHFMTLVRDGFLRIARSEPNRVMVFDALRSPEDIARDVSTAVASLLASEIP